jgi:metal-responsive CopG/Arc/MetJ family transcriptional regulator
MTEKIIIRIDLEGELARKFEVIKREKGIENNTDVLRNLISEAYKQLQKEASNVKK